MKQTLQTVSLILGLILLGCALLLVWASSDYVSEQPFGQTESYGEAPASATRDTFTVMTYNVGQFKGMPGNSSGSSTRSLAKVIGLIRRAAPDFIAFQEMDFAGHRKDTVDELDSLATRLAFAESARAITWNERYIPPFVGSRIEGGPVASGQVILSKFPVRRYSEMALPRGQTLFLKDAFAPKPVAQVGAVGIGGWPLLIINAHLDAPDEETREKQAREVNSLYVRLARQGYPIILLGDFNAPMPAAMSALPNRARQAYAGDETMEILLKGTDLQPALSEGAYVTGQSINTFPADDPTYKMTHIFYRSRLIIPTNAEVRCGDSAQPPSDHCAETMSFLLPRPEGQLPEAQLPDEALPSLDSLVRRQAK